MAWVNVLDVAGVTATIEYSAGTPSPLAVISGGKLVFPGGYPSLATFADLVIADTAGTLAACPEYPAIDMRATFDCSGMTGSPNVQAVVRIQGTGSPTVNYLYNPPAPDVRTAVYSGTNLRAGMSYDSSGGGSIAGATVLLEVDITAPDPPDPAAFWTDFAGTKEILA